jgi:hypothetical protein
MNLSRHGYTRRVEHSMKKERVSVSAGMFITITMAAGGAFTVSRSNCGLVIKVFAWRPQLDVLDELALIDTPSSFDERGHYYGDRLPWEYAAKYEIHLV